MAISTGFTLLQLAHGKMFITNTGNIKIRMAIFATIRGNVYRMAEYGASWAKIDLFNSMTFLAVGFYAKAGFAIVAASTGSTFFHISHTGSCAAFTGLEYLIVTFNTFIHTFVYRMAECRETGFLNLENYIDGRFMTSITITFHTEHG